ncbi:lytic transglycosylase [Alsobacter soli]|uniref:Lytic transglycosylase n=2 Tax=Alsobacter soli TaxID=2109933 RepID=A0A2T1HUP2_9HYPH|nr:lytic transglycosylase [Alsobacter soli]
MQEASKADAARTEAALGQVETGALRRHSSHHVRHSRRHHRHGGHHARVSAVETGSVAEQAASAAAEQQPVRGKALGYASQARGGLKDLIAKHAAANGVPFALADAVVRIESRYNPGASNGGAVGLMQIKPQTARGLGYSGGAAGLKNPETNLTYGMKYLAQAYRMSGGSTCATVMRYQSGHYARRASAANRAYCGKAQSIMASAS